MGEYDRTGNGQNGEADWDLRSILCDMAKNWWIILLIACSAAMITYTVLTAVHRDQYTVENHVCREWGAARMQMQHRAFLRRMR